MTQEEKAKRYDELLLKLQKAKVDDNVCDEMYYRVIDDIVPELKESDDEKVREVLIGYFKRYKEEECGIKTFYGIPADDILAWLEKQGTRPRYNIGDIICDKLCTTLNKDAQPNMEIVDIKNGMYICDKGSFPVSQQDEFELVGKKIDTKLNGNSVSNELRAASTAHAEKEMKNQTFPDNLEFELIYAFEEGARWNAAQKSTWSEKHIADVFEKVGLAKIAREQSNDNLTIALQDAMIELSKVTLQPNPTAWSKEDENLLELSFENLTELKDRYGEEYGKVGDCISWLKSLKNRYTWKPSDEQMAALNNAILLNEDHYNGAVLSTLHEQLMKLK